MRPIRVFPASRACSRVSVAMSKGTLHNAPWPSFSCGASYFYRHSVGIPRVWSIRRGKGGKRERERGREKRTGSEENSLQRLKKNIASAINRAAETFAARTWCDIAETSSRKQQFLQSFVQREFIASLNKLSERGHVYHALRYMLAERVHLLCTG